MAQGAIPARNWTASLAVLIAALAAPTLALVWRLTFSAGCWALLSLVVGAGIVAVYAKTQVQARREWLADGYFEPGSFLHDWSRRTPVLWAVSFGASLGLMALLGLAATAWGPAEIVFFLCDALVIVALFALFRALAGRTLRVSPRFRNIVAARWAVGVNVFVGVVALLALRLAQPPPAYVSGAGSIGEAMAGASSSIGSACALLDRALRIAREADAALWFAMIRAEDLVPIALLRWLGWAALLLGGGASLLAFSRLAMQLTLWGVQWSEREAGR